MNAGSSFCARIGLSLVVSVLSIAAAHAADSVETDDEACTPRPPARSGHMACTDGELIYLFGGAARGTPSAPQLDIWFPDTNRWNNLVTPPARHRALGAMVLLKNRIYLIGGIGKDNQPVPVIDVYDFESHDWLEPIPDPHPASRHVAVAYGSFICIIGGIEDGEVYSNRVRMLDTTTNTWRDMPALEHGRHGHAAAVRDGMIYVTGGYALDGESSAQSTSVEVFEPAKNAWQPGPALNAPHAFHGMANIARTLYAFGTRGDDRSMEMLKPGAAEWTQAAPIPEPRHRFASATIGTKLYIIDGEDERGDTAPAIFVYDSESNSWTQCDE